MKHIFTLFFIIFTTVSYSQVPSNYYDSANGLSGYTLKSQLYNILTNGDTDRGYGALYSGYESTHSDNRVENGYENDNTVLLFYTENPNGSDAYEYNHFSRQCGNYNSENDCYNREHIIPQSSFGSASPMQNDIHHVIPSDGFVNGQRGSLPFGTVGSANWTSQNGSKRGSSSVTGYGGQVFEPIDEFKGDIARAILYFVTRYETTVAAYTSFEMFNGTPNQALENWAVDLLLEWHNTIDPVDDRELARNDAAYNYQGNANPFVDHPEYVNLIWNPQPDTEAPSNPTNLTTSNTTDNTIDLNWDISTDNVGVQAYDVYVDGSYNSSINTNSFTVQGLTADTNYCFTVKAKDASGNESGASNQACDTTTDDGSSGGIDIFFSEYIEGSGVNKVLEIANFTGNTVLLSAYSLKLSTNGSESWGAVYNFSSNAQIISGDVYVISQGSNTLCTSEVDDLNNAITSFNGNDAIGLFKDNVLIDILGTLGNDSDYAKDKTLVRNGNVSTGNIIYTPSEWESFPTNNCDNLGSHAQTLSLQSETAVNMKFYPNPNASNSLQFNSQVDIAIIIYDILGKKILSKDISSNDNTIDISRLGKGIYLVQMSNKKTRITKKLVRN